MTVPEPSSLRDARRSPYDEFRAWPSCPAVFSTAAPTASTATPATYQRIVTGLDRRFHRSRSGPVRPVHFPPVLVAVRPSTGPGYLHSFPDLMGSSTCFRGGDRTTASSPALRGGRQLAGAPRAGRGRPELGRLPFALPPVHRHGCRAADGTSRSRTGASATSRAPILPGWWPSGCTSSSTSATPSRPDVPGHDAGQWRPAAGRPGLPMSIVPANDPFFGRLGTILASTQLEENLKLEGVTPICSDERPTAIISGNLRPGPLRRPLRDRDG